METAHDVKVQMYKDNWDQAVLVRKKIQTRIFHTLWWFVLAITAVIFINIWLTFLVFPPLIWHMHRLTKQSEEVGRLELYYADLYLQASLGDLQCTPLPVAPEPFHKLGEKGDGF